jgi:hypothetical protein
MSVLAAEGFLPGYGLDTGSVQATAQVPRQLADGADLDLRRAAAMAVREYVPGNLIYANGHRFVPRYYHLQVDSPDPVLFQVDAAAEAVREVGAASGTQGLGSAYVTEHFADRAMKVKPAHSKFSSYFNMDNGTGAIRGVYLQGNEAVTPIFEACMKPFNNIGMNTLTIRDTGGTDHLAFDAVGLPGFQFIQDPVEYSSRTHHSNMDLYERIQEEDMRKNAVIVASFVYLTANRDLVLPRKPLPKPQPAAGGRGTGAGRGQ